MVDTDWLEISRADVQKYNIDLKLQVYIHMNNSLHAMILKKKLVLK